MNKLCFIIIIIIFIYYYLNKPENHLLLKKNIDTDEMLSSILVNDWSKYRAMHNNKHSDTKSILLKNENIIVSNPVQYYPIFNFIHNFLIQYPGQLFSVQLVFLPKGKTVKPHIDGIRNGKYYSDYYLDKDRYHLVLSGSYKYSVDNQTRKYKKGQLWWFDNKKIHKSKALTDRISLIFDVKHSNEIKNYGYHLCKDEWAINPNKINRIDIESVIKLINDSKRKAVLINHSDISWKCKYNPSEKMDYRYSIADESYPGILSKGVKNPENLPYRMIDGSHRITKLRNNGVNNSYFYIISEEEFYNLLI